MVVTGPSGVGKGTLIRALLERCPGLVLSISATTRAPRPGEVDGRDYHFLDDAVFEQRLAAGEFLEHATYAGNRYGTPRSELARVSDVERSDPQALVLEIELHGARQVRTALPEALQVFVAPPSLEALRARLVGRGSDDPAQIEQRLEVAAQELEARSEFTHVVVNDRLEDAVEELARLVATILEARPGGSPK